MNYPPNLTSPIFVGIFELDTAGTVLYSRDSKPGYKAEKGQNLVGQNFFENVADFENVYEFRRRFRNFIRSRQSTENFFFECRSIQRTIPVRVLLLRTQERKETEINDIYILDIRENEV